MSLFYSEAILARRGPLARVWLAAHYERKLSKTQTLQTDIGQSVGAIVSQDQAPMALRLSGQLLLGVVRIYSRKAKYLLDDCNEAIVKIKLAFRPGVVDMTEDQLAAPRAAITLDTAEGFDAEFLPQNMDWDIQPVGRQHIAHQKDITLAGPNFLEYGFDDNAFDFGDGLGVDDWAIDTGLTFGDEEAEAKDRVGQDTTISIELGRHDAGAGGSPRISIASNLRGDVGMDRDMSVLSKGAPDFGMGAPIDFGFNDNDLNFGDAPDMGLTFDDEPLAPKTPGHDSRASTPLSEAPPRTPPPGDSLGSFPTPTPRTAARIAQMAEQKDATARKKTKKQIVDSVIDLDKGPGGKRGGQWRDQDVSEITGEPRFLPRSTTVMQLLAIQADPVGHFMPTTTTPNGALFNAAPPGLAPELSAMFMFPVRDLRRPRAVLGEAEGAGDHRSPKKARIAAGGAENDDGPSVELGMRAESGAPFDITNDMGAMDISAGDFGAGFGDDYPGGAGADFTLDTGAMDVDMPDIQLELDEAVARHQKHRSVSRLVDDTRSTPGLGDDLGMDAYDSQSCTIGLFDMRSTRDSGSKGDTQTQTQTQMEEEAEAIERSTEQVQSKGFSKNTVKAIAVIRKGLAGETEAGETDPALSFNKVADKASRRAASAFFFELLVLTTRDCLKVKQENPFEDIEIRAKDKLYEAMGSKTGAEVSA